MALDNPKASIGSTSEFMVSSWPFVTSSTASAVGSPAKISFQMVTKTIMVSNLSATSTDTLSFGFTRNGVVTSSNKFIVKSGQTVTIDVKATSIFIQGESGTPAYSVFAGLTGILPNEMPMLTGSLWPGVG